MTLENLLQRRFGHPAFRPGQRAVVEHISEGQNGLVVMPTGHGKSLCYQLPALARSGTTIVVSPLIALMKDQVDSLHKKGIAATSINSSLSRDERHERIQAMQSGQYRLVYVAPERFNRSFMEALRRTEIGLFAIDEAHCISQWGHDFRPDYLRLGSVWKALGDTPLIALTATATPEVQDDILQQLGLPSARKFVTGFDRENLRLEVANARTKKVKFSMLPGLLQAVPALVYWCHTEACRGGHPITNVQGIQALAYHAGLDHDTRRQVQKLHRWTGTCGCGDQCLHGCRQIGHSHHCSLRPSGNIEAYYQEVGRAGRDGKPAKAILLLRPADRQLKNFSSKMRTPGRNTFIDRFVLQQQENPIWWSSQTIAGHLGVDERMVTSCLSVRRSGLIHEQAPAKTDKLLRNRSCFIQKKHSPSMSLK